MTATWYKIKNDKAFTLIELAIVMVVIGIMFSMGAGLVSLLIKRTKTTETKDKITAVVAGVAGYAATNNRLPSSGTISSDCPQSSSDFVSSISNQYDSFGKCIKYIYDDNLTATANSPYEGICGRRTTFLTVRKCTDAACASYSDVQNTAFIVFSSGANYNNQTGPSLAVTSATTQNIYEQLLLVDNYVTDINKTETYDDLVQYVTLDELRTKIGCSGSQLSIINNELPFGNEDSAYNASLYAQGGTGSVYYQWCWSSSSSSLPGDLTLTCAGTLGKSTDSCATNGWQSCSSVTIAGTPGVSTTANSYSITFYVKDNAGNTSQKSLVLTINPN
ncbi:MAG: prepilin-type N-terminal cleavage/methylation domain-containing protein [Nitrospirae bacterium YQR-1]